MHLCNVRLCMCVCVCALDGEGNRVFAGTSSKALVLVVDRSINGSVFDCYSDCLTCFNLPCRCHIHICLKNV